MNIRKLNYIVLPLITSIYLFVNLIFNVLNIKLCETDGCATSKTLLNFDQNYLYGLGLLSVVLILFIGIAAIRDNKIHLIEQIIFTIFLNFILLSETILISYLYLSTKSFCLICLVFYSLLWINFFLNFYSTKENLFIKTISKILIFNVIIILITLTFLKIENTETNTIVNEYTLLQSETCSHCKATKDFLDTNNIKYTKENYEKYMTLLGNLDLNTIPILIVKNNKSNFSILNGENEIKSFFDKKIKEKTILPILNNTNVEGFDFYNKQSILENTPSLIPTDDGCNINQPLNEKCD